MAGETADINKQWTLRKALRDFLGYSSAHGLERLAAAKSVYWKELDFPVITICNNNMLRKSKLTSELKAELPKLLNVTKEHWQNVSRLRRTSKELYADTELLHYMHDKLESLRNLVSDMKGKDLHAMGHQFNDMVLDCVFNGEDCRETNNRNIWRHLWVDPVGNCYMFNRVLPQEAKRGIQPYKTYLTGDQYGLRLLINIEQYEYLYGISPYAGIKVVIGTQGQMPFPLSEGINIGPGLTTGIELVMKKSDRLDPFNNKTCDKKAKLQTDNIYFKYNMTYSKKACRMSCLSNMQKDRCQCSQFHYTDDPDIVYCKSSNHTIDKCIDDVRDDFKRGSCEGRCPPMCSETDFARSVSAYQWPANSYKENFLASVQDIANITTMTSVQQISDNLLELHIYYGQMDYEHVEETLKYTFDDLISNIGGQMGIWIGVSALTISELIELIWICVHRLVRRRKRSSSPVTKNSMPMQSDKTNNVVS